MLFESRTWFDGIQIPMPLDESVVSQFGQMDVLSFDGHRWIHTGSIRRRIEINRRFVWRQLDEREQYPPSVFVS
ncbi:hypothetical protein ACFR99_07080 [Haloarchaeobius amylolyticus]|uniref:Uncharacterized protein n=1 Tax=Haloarchaeobius amylolyticus TaxID=1198296 RepID=A0ABD6BFG7_9EURY